MNEKPVNIGIVGEGKMGTAIFLYLLGFDFHLVWLCSSEQAKEEALKLFLKKAGSKLHCGVITEQEYRALLDGAMITSHAGDLSECDLIIEAIPEEADVKMELFRLLDKYVKPDCILTSNSSSILPSRLVPSASRKERFAGLHFFFPVQLKKYVEIISTHGTSNQTRELLADFLASVHKIPFFQDENNAFLLNRLFLDLQAGAFQICQEGGLSFREIDDLVKEHLFPAGVFEFFDHVGIDTMLASICAYSEEISGREDLRGLIAWLEAMKASNHLGLKTRKGFYDYSIPGSQKVLQRRLNPLEDERRRQVVLRLKGLFVDSAERALDSGTVSREFLREAVRDYTGMETDLF